MTGTALIISNKYPFPSDDGKKTVLAGFLAYLCDRLGRENVTYVVIGRQSATELPQQLCRTCWIDPPGRAAQVWHLAQSVAGIDDRSMQEALTYSHRVRRELEDLVRTLNPGLVVLDTLRVGQYFWSSRAPGLRRILYMDDLFSLRFRRMAGMSEDDREVRFNPAGTFSSSLPRIAQAVIRFGPLQRLLFRMESAKMDRRELGSVARFDQCLLINPNEAQLLREQCPGGPIFPVKPVLFTEPCPVPRRFDGTPLFLLFGSLRHPVYRASVVRFLERGMDGVLHRVPSAKICIVGGGADSEIQTLCRRFGSQVEIRGFVENLDAAFSTACALLVPLLAAGGLKLKILTALYYGLPIVSTDAGVDGIPLEDGRHFLRENALEHFAVPMARLCDVSYNQGMSRNASLLFREHYSKERIYADYDELIGARR